MGFPAVTAPLSYASQYLPYVPASIGAVGAAGYDYYKHGTMPWQPRKKAPKKVATKTRTKKRRRANVRPDGTSKGRYAMITKRGRKRRKKSVKSQLKALKRIIPAMSTKLFRDFNTIVLSTTSVNRQSYYDINCFDKTVLSNYAANLTAVDSAAAADYSASNSKIKMDLYFKLMMKNNMTTNAKLSYVFYVCKDDDNESPLECVLEELTDRGYTSLPSTSGPDAATATASIKPFRAEFGEGIHHVPLFSGAALRRNWRQVGKVKTAHLGPGDTVDLVYSRKNYKYEQEYKDQENSFSHIKGMDVRLVVVCQGALAHDSSNHQKVGRSGFHFDCEQQRQCMVRYANPKGLNEVKYTDDLTSTGFSVPNHADDKASAIEGDSL